MVGFNQDGSLTGQLKHLSPANLVCVIEVEGKAQQLADHERPLGHILILVVGRRDQSIVLVLDSEGQGGDDGHRVFESRLVLVGDTVVHKYPGEKRLLWRE